MGLYVFTCGPNCLSKGDLLYREKRPISKRKETNVNTKRDIRFYVFTGRSNCLSKRDWLCREKRPISVRKETYFSMKRDIRFYVFAGGPNCLSKRDWLCREKRPISVRKETNFNMKRDIRFYVFAGGPNCLSILRAKKKRTKPTPTLRCVCMLSVYVDMCIQKDIPIYRSIHVYVHGKKEKNKANTDFKVCVYVECTCIYTRILLRVYIRGYFKSVFLAKKGKNNPAPTLRCVCMLSVHVYIRGYFYMYIYVDTSSRCYWQKRKGPSQLRL